MLENFGADLDKDEGEKPERRRFLVNKNGKVIPEHYFNFRLIALGRVGRTGRDIRSRETMGYFD